MPDDILEPVPVLAPYNPLDKKNLGEQVSSALLKTQISPLPPAKFIGAGVYAIYYSGNFPGYKLLAELNANDKYLCPIYVGKAVPEGARKSGTGINTERSFALYKRLNEHAKSIEAAANLELSDFHCRFLAVDDIWIPLAESMLIEKFLPIWNCLLEGFGNHAPGKGRKDTTMSPWDFIHPGRNWAKNLKAGSKSKDQLDTEVRDYLKTTLAKFSNL